MKKQNEKKLNLAPQTIAVLAQPGLSLAAGGRMKATGYSCAEGCGQTGDCL